MAPLRPQLHFSIRVTVAASLRESRITRIRSWTSATKALGSVIIIVQDFSVSPVARSFHSSQRPANVIGSPSAHVI